jgi:hypothetical protein
MFSDLPWIPIGLVLFFYSLSFALVSQKALNYLRKWLMSPIIYLDTFRNLIGSIRSSRPEEGNLAKRSTKVFIHFVISSSIVVIVFIASAIGISGLAQLIVNPTIAPIAPSLEFIQGAAILGILTALMTRVFSLQISDAVVKGVFFQGFAFLGFFILALVLYPSLVGSYFNSAFSAAGSLWSSAFIQTIVILYIAVFGLIEWFSLSSFQNVSVGLFRERRESLETGVQILLKDQIVASVKKILAETKPMRSIRWATGGGFENELEQAIFSSTNSQTLIRFIASQATVDGWGTTRATNMRRYTHVSPNVGFVRFMIINDEILIEVLPMPDGQDSSNTGMIVKHPLLVNDRILSFDNWYARLPQVA